MDVTKWCQCGRPACWLVTMLNLPPRFAGDPTVPMCDDCLQDHHLRAQEVIDHEMQYFGGAYGVPSYTAELVPVSPCVYCDGTCAEHKKLRCELPR